MGYEIGYIALTTFETFETFIKFSILTGFLLVLFFIEYIFIKFQFNFYKTEQGYKIFLEREKTKRLFYKYKWENRKK